MDTSSKRTSGDECATLSKKLQEVRSYGCLATESNGNFPGVATELSEPNYTIYQLFFDLTPMAEQAHKNHDTDSLGRIYGFAEWCLHQTDKDLWNSAGVAFYEHLFDERSLWDQIVPWLSTEVISQVQGLWEMMLPREEYQELTKVLAKHAQAARPTNIQARWLGRSALEW